MTIPYFPSGNSAQIQTVGDSTVGILFGDSGTTPNILTVTNLDTGNAVIVNAGCSPDGITAAAWPFLVDGVGTDGVGTIIPAGGTAQFLINSTYNSTLGYVSVSYAKDPAAPASNLAVSPGVIK